MDKMNINQHDDRFRQDGLDQLLFESAKQTTDAMDFQAALKEIYTMRQKKIARRRNAIRYASLAATLVIGLGAGALYGRQTAPPLPSPIAQIDTTPMPDSSGSGIVADPFGLSQPNATVVDPPTTENNEEIIVVDPPKTDGGMVTQEYGEDIVLENIPPTKDITKLLPGWLPENFSNIQYEVDYGNWSCYSTYSGSIYADLNLGFPLSKLGDLAIGSGRPVFIRRENEPDVPVENEFSYIVRLKEDVYLTVSFYNVSLDDALKVMQHIGA